jgi:hypothetical protein
MGRRPKEIPLDEVIEKALREQLVVTKAGTKERQEAMMTAIKWRAVQARIEAPEEGAGFN